MQDAFNSLDPHEQAPEPVLAWLTARDFAIARATPGFAIWRSRREFLDERDALFVGYGASGVLARRQLVRFDAFERWARLTGAPVDVDGLDEFAAHWRWRAAHRDAPATGYFRMAPGSASFAVAATGAQCVPIAPTLFAHWRDDLGKLDLFAPPSLDDYATQVVGLCIGSGRGVRRPSARTPYMSSAEFEDRE